MSASACPACGAPLAAWREVPSGEPSDARRFALLRCPRCGTAVTGGEPPGPEAYERGVYAVGSPRALPLVRVLQRATVDQPARILRRAGLPRGARVLDAGAGRGRLVEALERSGFRAQGIDPSARSATAAVEAGRPVQRSAIADHDDTGLDAVVLWHVLEHLDDAPAALDRVWSWLRPGGLLLVGVPNIDSLQARIAGEGWLHLDVPRHRLHLTPDGLGWMLRGAGFEPGAVRHLVWEHNPSAMWMALLTRLGMRPGFPFHLLKRNIDPRPLDLGLVALGLPLAPFAVLLEAGAAAARRGGTIAQVARRPESGASGRG